jgi:hypothetical protein
MQFRDGKRPSTPTDLVESLGLLESELGAAGVLPELRRAVHYIDEYRD